MNNLRKNTKFSVKKQCNYEMNQGLSSGLIYFFKIP